MHDLEVIVSYPQAPSKVWSLVAQTEYNSSHRDGLLTIYVPKLELFDAIIVE